MNWKLFNRPLGLCDISGGYAPQKKGVAWFVPLIIATAMSAGTTAYGAAQSARANRKARARLSAEEAKTEAERIRKMNESYMDTAAGQNMLRQARREADRVWKREEGSAAVSGASDASKQMAKDSINQAMGDAIANIAAEDTARRDRADEVYAAREQQLAQQQMTLDQQQGQAVAQAAAGLSSTIMSTGLGVASHMMSAGSPGGSGVANPNKEMLKQMGGENQQWLQKNEGTVKAAIDNADKWDAQKKQISSIFSPDNDWIHNYT